MAAKILIKRTFSSGMTDEVQALLNKLRTAARSQPGYITGETLNNPDNPRETLVISTWENIDRWREWKEKSERKRLEFLLETYVEGATKFEEYVGKK